MRRTTMVTAVAALLIGAPPAVSSPDAPGLPGGTVCDATGSVSSFQDYYGSSNTFWSLQMDASGSCRTPSGARRAVTLSGDGFSWTCEDTVAGPHWSGLSFDQQLTLTDPQTASSETLGESWDSAAETGSVLPLGDAGFTSAFVIGRPLDLPVYPVRTEGAATAAWPGMSCRGSASVTLHWVT